MICKWCGENEVNEGEQCGFCGTIGGEDKPREKPIDQKKKGKKK